MISVASIPWELIRVGDQCISVKGNMGVIVEKLLLTPLRRDDADNRALTIRWGSGLRSYQLHCDLTEVAMYV